MIVDTDSCIGGGSRNLNWPNKRARSMDVCSDTSANEKGVASTSKGKLSVFSYFKPSEFD